MMVRTSGALRRGAGVALLAFVLVACGGDDSATNAGAGGDGDVEDSSTSVADTSADEPDDDHADEEHEGDADEEHDEDDDDHDDDADEEHDEHDDEEHDEHDEVDHDDDGSSGGLGAHEHGVAELSVAWSESEVIVDLISPTQNIFGFEYEPSTDEERALVADRTEALSEPGVLVINEEAGCDLVDDVATEVEFEGSHAELTASWLFRCEHADEISQLDVAALFAAFPNIEDIDAQWVSPSGQSAAELSPSATVLDLG